MTGKRAENSIKNKGYIKARSLLRLKQVYIRRKVTFIEKEKCPLGMVAGG